MENKETTEENLSFEYLVLALGSSYVHPFQTTNYDRSSQISCMQDTFNKVTSAKHILVIGEIFIFLWIKYKVISFQLK